MDKCSCLFWFATFCWQISCIDGHIKKNIWLIKSFCSRELSYMNPCFIESIGIWTSWISSPIHFVHSTKNYPEIILFYVMKKLSILCIKFASSNLCCGKHIWWNRNMIDFIFAKLLVETRDYFLYMRTSWIKNKRNNGQIQIIFTLDLLDIFYAIVPWFHTKKICLWFHSQGKYSYNEYYTHQNFEFHTYDNFKF